MVGLMYVHQVSPTVAELAGGGSIDYFTSDLVAMELQGQWDLQSKNAEVGFDFDFGFLPISEVQSTVTGGSGFCCSSGSEYPDTAWEFLASYTSTETLADMVGRPGRGIPARWSATPAYLGAGATSLILEHSSNNSDGPSMSVPLWPVLSSTTLGPDTVGEYSKLERATLRPLWPPFR